jgi:hypothetical protein
MSNQRFEVVSIYQQWGFTSSPFQTTSLPPSPIGAQLITGRNKELQRLINLIVGYPKMPTVEGLNGVGKTSIVNVAAYHLYQAHIDSNGESPLFIPCRKIFQLRPDQNLESFVDDVLYEVAQTLIEKAAELSQSGRKIDTAGIDRWLNSPQLKTFQGGISLATFGASLGKQAETNTSKGFDRSGFRKEIMSWLATLFPTPDQGGVICVIDNLELLQSSEIAKAMIEQLRDELLTYPGLRWVLCGALGIVYGVVASTRMGGYLHNPIVVGEMDPTHAPDILKNRISAYAIDESQHALPLLAADFAELYRLLHGNLRSVLSNAEDYCNWVDEQEEPTDDQERHQKFVEWLAELTADAYSAVQRQLRPRALGVFQKAVEIGGVFSPSDFADFGFNGIPQFRPSIKDLEDTGLLVSTRDDGDKRRKTIQITAKGWMVNYHLQSVANAAIETLPEVEGV